MMISRTRIVLLLPCIYDVCILLVEELSHKIILQGMVGTQGVPGGPGRPGQRGIPGKMVRFTTCDAYLSAE